MNLLNFLGKNDVSYQKSIVERELMDYLVILLAGILETVHLLVILTVGIICMEVFQILMLKEYGQLIMLSVLLLIEKGISSLKIYACFVLLLSK